MTILDKLQDWISRYAPKSRLSWVLTRFSIFQNRSIEKMMSNPIDEEMEIIIREFLSHIPYHPDVLEAWLDKTSRMLASKYTSDKIDTLYSLRRHIVRLDREQYGEYLVGVGHFDTIFFQAARLRIGQFLNETTQTMQAEGIQVFPWKMQINEEHPEQSVVINPNLPEQ